MIFKNLVAKIALTVIIAASILIPVAAMASSNGTYINPSLWPTGYWATNGLVSCTGNYVNPTANACTNLCDLIGTFINIIYFAMSIAIFIITPIMFVVGSIMVMISGANPEMLGRGKKILISTVVGLAIVLCSYLIVSTVISVLGIGGVGGFTAPVCSVQ